MRCVKQGCGQIPRGSLPTPTRAAQAKVMKHMQKSTQIMHLMNGLVKLPEISQTMQNLSKEMVKAGVIEELVDDAMGEDEEEMEEEGQEEVDKVLAEITTDLAERAGAAPTTQVRTRTCPVQRVARSSRVSPLDARAGGGTGGRRGAAGCHGAGASRCGRGGRL